MQQKDSDVIARERRQYKHGVIRRAEIMDALVSLLGSPVQEGFSTAQIAAKTGISEAALYRHFSGKTEMIEAVLKRTAELLDQTLRGADGCPDVAMLDRAYLKLQYLLVFALKNPGLTRLLTGEALIYEAHSLTEKKERILRAICDSIQNTLALAIVGREISNKTDTKARAQLMTDFVISQYLAFSQSGFELDPTENLEKVAPILFNFAD